MIKWEYYELNLYQGITNNPSKVTCFKSDGKHEFYDIHNYSVFVAWLGKQGWDLTSSNNKNELYLQLIFK